LLPPAVCPAVEVEVLVVSVVAARHLNGMPFMTPTFAALLETFRPYFEKLRAARCLFTEEGTGMPKHEKQRFSILEADTTTLRESLERRKPEEVGRTSQVLTQRARLNMHLGCMSACRCISRSNFGRSVIICPVRLGPRLSSLSRV
jgi:hypothetical protein